jgi:hypothetical protein
MNKKLLALVLAGLTIAPAMQAADATPGFFKKSTNFLGFTGDNKSRMLYTIPAVTATAASAYIGYKLSQDADKTWTAMKQCFYAPAQAWAYDKYLTICTYVLAASAGTIVGKGAYDLSCRYLFSDKNAAELKKLTSDLEVAKKALADNKDEKKTAELTKNVADIEGKIKVVNEKIAADKKDVKKEEPKK